VQGLAAAGFLQHLTHASWRSRHQVADAAGAGARAGAEYLLDIQLKVADRVGVQLVYTTGVFDTNALSKFPCVLRLRNDLDMRTGMQRIRIADSLRAALLNGRRADDGRGYLDVARVTHERANGSV